MFVFFLIAAILLFIAGGSFLVGAFQGGFTFMTIVYIALGGACVFFGVKLLRRFIRRVRARQADAAPREEPTRQEPERTRRPRSEQVSQPRPGQNRQTSLEGTPLTPLQQQQARADHGDVNAQYNFAFALIRGEGNGSKDDYVQAMPYLIQAADKGHVQASALLGAVYAAGKDGVVIPSNGSAVKYLTFAANKGDAPSMLALGKAYDTGDLGLTKDSKQAMQWYEKAAKKNNAEAALILGLRYVESNPENAFKYLKAAFDAGERKAAYALGHAYEKGIGTKVNLSKAIECYRLAAEHEDHEAELALGHAYFDGNGIERDQEKGFEHFKKAAEGGLEDAYLPLAECYRQGKGTGKNLQKAVSYFQKNRDLQTGGNIKPSMDYNFGVPKGHRILLSVIAL